MLDDGFKSSFVLDVLILHIFKKAEKWEIMIKEIKVKIAGFCI